MHLTEPKLQLAIEAITKANPLGVPGSVTWRTRESIDDYSVEFYGQTFPETNVGGGPRECIGFRAAAVLKTLIVRPDAIE